MPGHAADHLRQRPRALPRVVPDLRREGDEAALRAVGAGGDHRPLAVPAGGRGRLPRHRRARAVRRRRGEGLPLQPDHLRGDPGRRGGGLRAGDHAAQRHLPALLPEPGHRRAEGALAARHRLRRADHRHRHDRARHRLRPRRHDDDRHPPGRPLPGERVQDVHHERHQLRHRDRGGQDRPGQEAQRHVAAGRRAGHGRLRAGPQPREAGPALPGHRRAVLPRRGGAGREPAGRRG